MLSNLKVFHRILLVAVVLIGGMIVIALTGQAGMNKAVAGLDTVYKDRVVPLRDLKTIADMYAVNIVDTTHKARNRNIDFAQALSNIEQAEKIITTKWGEYLATVLVAEEEKLVAEIKPLMAKTQAPILKLKEILRQGDAEGLAAFAATDLYPAIDPISDRFSALVEVQLAVAKMEYDETSANSDVARTINIAIVLLASLGGALIALLVARQITRELGGEPSEVAAIAQRVAVGHLDQETHIAPGLENSVLGSMEQMRKGLRDMVSHIRDGAGKLAAASQQMATGAQQLSASAAQQSESTAAIAVAMEEMATSIDQIAHNASEARSKSQNSGDAADRGIAVVSQTIKEMTQITNMVTTTTNDIENLDQRSAEIGTVINVIREIADQTNLLALNAAIEAARAGETGRGFAVVADEVRKLAERTGHSTTEIVKTVEAIQGSSRQMLDRTESSQAMINNGLRLANESTESMMAVQRDIELTLASVNQVNEALNEQNMTCQQIGRDIENIAQLTDENAHTVHSLNEAMQHVKKEAEALDALVSRFRT